LYVSRRSCVDATCGR